MADFADYMAMPKYVVSTTLTEDHLVSNWGETTILRTLDEVAEPLAAAVSATAHPALHRALAHLGADSFDERFAYGLSRILARP